MQGIDALGGAGLLGVNITHGRGFTPEEFAEQFMGKFMNIADTAPPAIRDQAIEFRGRVRSLLVVYLTQAARSERTTLYNTLKNAGHADVAELILKL